MSSLIVELTNRCNLSCQHCPSGRHGGRSELELVFIQALSSVGSSWLAKEAVGANLGRFASQLAPTA